MKQSGETESASGRKKRKRWRKKENVIERAKERISDEKVMEKEKGKNNVRKVIETKRREKEKRERMGEMEYVIKGGKKAKEIKKEKDRL